MTELSTPNINALAARKVTAKSFTFLTNGSCSPIGHISPEALHRINLDTGTFNGEYYPLTYDESKYLSKEVLSFGPHKVAGGYTAVMGANKYLVPTIKIPFGGGTTYDEAKHLAQSYMHGLSYASRTVGGYWSINEELFSASTTHGVICRELLIPMSFVQTNAETQLDWKALLNELGRLSFCGDTATTQSNIQ